jgi:8-oxo-dGTP pyrophosphatase MutT (NUDIX family)
VATALEPDLAKLADALGRGKPRQFRHRPWLGRAAVAAVLRSAPDGVELLLAVRARAPGDRWSGHVAFPGGLAARSDELALDTALRETLEEAGLDLEREAELVGRLSEVLVARHGSLAPLVVAPLVFALTRPAALALGPELVRAEWIPLAALRRARARRSRSARALGYFLPAFGERALTGTLWGLTLSFVDDLLRRTARAT